MGLVFGDTFDRYTGITAGALPLTTHYTLTSSVLAFSGSLIGGRYGGQALRINSPAVGDRERFVNRALLADMSEAGIGFAFRRNQMDIASTGAGATIFRLRSGLGIQMVIGVDFLGRLLVGRTNFTSGLIGRSDPGLIDQGSWYFVDIDPVFDPVAGTVKLALEGVEVISETGNTTGVGGSSIADSYDLVSYNSNVGSEVLTDFDDFHLLDVAVRWPQPSRGEPLFPNSDAGPNQWTRNTGASDFSAIDEATCDGDATYLADATVGHKSRHGLTDLSTVPAAIYGVQVATMARKDDAGLRQIRANLGSGPTTANGATQTLAVNYDERLDPYDEDPDAAAAFNATGVNALEVELEVVA